MSSDQAAVASSHAHQADARTNRVFASATKGFTYLFSFSLFSKLITFTANSFINRNLDPSTKGIIFSLELFEASVIFLSREAIRRACLRSSVAGDTDSQQDSKKSLLATDMQQMINVSWLTVPIGCIVSTIAFLFFSNFSQWQQTNEQKAVAEAHYVYTSLVIYVISCTLSMFSQPFFIIIENLLLYNVRVKVEGIALLMKVFFNTVLVLLLDEKFAAIAFALSEFVFASCLIIGYLSFLVLQGKAREFGIPSLVPRRLPKQQLEKAREQGISIYFGLFDERLLRLFGNFSLQSIVKFSLTQGEKYVLMLYKSLTDQGVYDIVSHLGSMVARIVFSPIEENAHTTWSKLLHAEQGEAAPSSSALAASATLLSVLLKFLILLGLVFVCFGPAYSYTLFYMVYGSRWASTEAPYILSLYCVYVLAMAVNGVVEAFVHAASSKAQTKQLNYWMIIFSVVYLGACILFLTVLGWGTASLVLANVVNMLMRIIYCTRFIQLYFSRLGSSALLRIRGILPHPFVLVTLCSALPLLKMSEHSLEHQGWSSRVAHIAIGCICLAVVSIELLVFERVFLQRVRKLFSGKKLE